MTDNPKKHKIIDPETASRLGEARKSFNTSGMSETELMLRGYGLTTAEMFYRMPDHPSVLNSFIWQDYDLAPDHDKLLKFIDFWRAEIEGPLHSVRFTHRKMISSGEWRQVVGEFGPKDLGVSSGRYSLH